MRWTGMCHETCGTFADGEIVWSWRAHAGAQVRAKRKLREGDGGKRGFTEEITYKP